jgi:hypothetical protein
VDVTQNHSQEHLTKVQILIVETKVQARLYTSLLGIHSPDLRPYFTL